MIDEEKTCEECAGKERLHKVSDPYGIEHYICEDCYDDWKEDVSYRADAVPRYGS